jgi:site-specific DNA recombinase
MPPAGLPPAAADSAAIGLDVVAGMSKGGAVTVHGKEPKMIATATIPAVAYLRRSTDRQEQSLGDQRKEIIRYARENGYTVVREYVDDAISGTSAEERPGFQQMVANAESGEFKAVIVWNSDRFSRGDVTETEHYRYLLRQAGVTLLSVTEDYLARDGIDGDVLRTVKQFQNRQFSISLSQNTLRGQISAVMAESDPGRAAPYGYDREILAPNGSVLFRIRFCPGRVREVYDKDGKLQARYEKGQSLLKPGKECKARLVLSAPERVQVVRDIFRMCLDGMGFASIAAALNAKGIPGPVRDVWGSTTVKAMLENPAYRGDLVWNRRTEAKFYRVQDGRAQKRQRQSGEAKVVRTPKDEWVVVPNVVPTIVSREDWEKAQVMVAKRRRARGGAGHRNRRWLLTGVLECGDCGHKFWGDPRRKGRKPGRAPVVTNYYTCSGRRSHGKTICEVPSALRAEQIEQWVLGKLGKVIATDENGVEAAIKRFLESVAMNNPGAADAERMAREIKQVNDIVAALAMNIDPANLPMLNDRLTQLRLRKETLEEELRVARRASTEHDAGTLRRWARAQLAGLQAATDGVRNDRTREVIGTYVDRIVVWPSQKRGEMHLNPAARGLWKEHDRPGGRSWCKLVGATGFEPATS